MSLTEACESLVEALDARRTDIVKSLLDHLCQAGEGGQTDLQTVLANTCTKHGTVLHYAVQGDLTDAVRALLLAGADPGIQSDSGVTALDMVAHNPALLQVFADELLRAVAAGNCKRAEVLLDAGVTIGAEDSVLTKNSALHWAASFGSAEVVDLLLKRGANVNAANADGCTPLHDAVQRKDAAIVKILLDAGADVSTKAINGKLKGKTPKDLSSKIKDIAALFPDSEDVAADRKNSTNLTLDCQPSKHLPISTEMVHAPLQTTPPITAQVVDNNAIAGRIKDERLYLLWPQSVFTS